VTEPGEHAIRQREAVLVVIDHPRIDDRHVFFPVPPQQGPTMFAVPRHVASKIRWFAIRNVR
jgi:hypothetical protein